MRLVENWLEFDEFIDVESSLLALLISIERLPVEPLLWKNILLNVHAALQGACVCILTRTDGGGALTVGAEAKYLKYLNNGSAIAQAERNGVPTPDPLALPDMKIQALPGLLRRLPEEVRKDLPKCHIEFEECSDTVTRDLYRLHNFRTTFSHFPVTSWLIEGSGLPRIVVVSLNLIEEIVCSDGWMRQNRFKDTRVLELISQTRLLLAKI